MNKKIISNKTTGLISRLPKIGVPLEQVNFADYPGFGDVTSRAYRQLVVVYNDKALQLRLSKNPLQRREGSFLNAELGYRDTYVRMYLTLEIAESVVTVSDGIVKYDNGERLPRGIGMQLWSRIPEYIQTLADLHGVPYIHTVSRDLGISDTPLTAEKWGTIFLPRLEQFGYTRVDDATWEKEYGQSIGVMRACTQNL